MPKYSEQEKQAAREELQRRMSAGSQNQQDPIQSILSRIGGSAGSISPAQRGARGMANAMAMRAGITPRYGTQKQTSALEDLINRGKAAEAAKTIKNPSLYKALTDGSAVESQQEGASDYDSTGVPDQDFERDAYGDLTERGKIQQATAEKKALIEVQTPKEIRTEQEAAEQKRAEAESIRSNMEANLKSVRKAKEGEKYFGRFGGLPSWATPEVFNEEEYGKRQQWENEVNRLLAQKVIDVMNKMKRVSKTGATGFGQLSNKELQLLRDASTALTRSLPGEEAMGYLDELEELYTKFLYGGEQTAGQTAETGNADPLGILQ